MRSATRGNLTTATVVNFPLANRAMSRGKKSTFAGLGGAHAEDAAS
jgi:hypothetical protein